MDLKWISLTLNFTYFTQFSVVFPNERIIENKENFFKISTRCQILDHCNYSNINIYQDHYLIFYNTSLMFILVLNPC